MGRGISSAKINIGIFRYCNIQILVFQLIDTGLKIHYLFHMKATSFLILACLFAIVACSDTKPTNHSQPAKKEIIEQAYEFEHIIFGRFCGFCNGECAVMYKIDFKTKRLFADHTESYWKHHNGNDLQFATEIDNKSKIEAAMKIPASVPLSILEAKSKSRFGCPDCADGCGIYFEFKKDGETKSFYIDYQTDQLEGEIKDFADYLRSVIETM